ncbi:MAG: glycosyltransferase family 39 protein [Nitrospinota bacterium]
MYLAKYKIIFTLLFIAFALRLTFSYFFPPIPCSANSGDIVRYYGIAISLADGEGFSLDGKPTAYVPPAYSFILATFFKIFSPSYQIAQLINAVLGVISCILAYFICRKTFSERASILALCIMALSPTNIIWSAMIFSENLFLPLILGVILLWVHFIHDGDAVPKGLGKLLLSGILLGIASLTRSQAALLSGILFVWLLYNKKSFSNALIATLIVFFSMIFTILPWTIRNKEVFGSYVLITTNAGLNLLQGNHPGATGMYHDPPGGYPGGDNEAEKNRLSKEMALSYIFSNPGNFIKLIPKKLFFLWCAESVFTFRHDLLTKLPHIVGYFLMGAALILYYLFFFIMPVALIKFKMLQYNSKLVLQCFKQETVILFALLFLYLSLLHAISVAGPRYNYPFYPFLIIFVSGSIDTWLKNPIYHPLAERK